MNIIEIASDPKADPGPTHYPVYLKGRLEQWGQGYHSGTESPMPMVASHLGPNEIEALASYLSFVK